MKERLRAVLSDFGHTQSNLADLLGITYQSVSIKMNAHQDFTQGEIYKIMVCYNLTPEQVVDIFFNTKDKVRGSLVQG